MIDTQIRNASFAGWAFAPSAPVRLDVKIYQPVVMAGTTQTAEIQLKNIGTANWDANTKLVALPHDGGNPFYDPSWIAPNRIVGAANTPLGGTNTFRFTLGAPTTPGRYKIEFAFVQEGNMWFLEPGDRHIWFEIDVRFPVDIGSSRPQMFIGAYNRNAGSAKLGFPLATVGWSGPESDAVRVTTQAFDEGGYIIHDENQDNPINSVPAYYLTGPILKHFQDLDGSRSWIGGGPTSDQFSNSSGQQQVNFPKGYITWDGTTVRDAAWPTALKNQWHAEYHNGSNLNAGPTWVQNEAEINHQWGTNAPGNGKWGVWNDNFSARWTGTFAFSAGDYSFKADSNDEVKVWIDGQLLLDSASLKQTTRFISAGDHNLVVEYRHRNGAASLRFGWQSENTGCTASIENGTVYINKRNVQLRFNVPGATQMMLSNDGGFAGASWQPYQSTVNWTLSDPGNRIATLVIYSRFRDASGKELCGGNLIDDIVYDPLPPTLNVRVVQLGTQALQTESTLAANTLTLQLVALDQQGGSGVADMQISTDKTFANAAW
jgi:PA14 domain.